MRQALLEEHNFVPVFLNPAAAHGHYDTFCKTVLWPLLHYVVETEVSHQSSDATHAWAAYCSVNQTYAAEIIAAYKPGDIGTTQESPRGRDE